MGHAFITGYWGQENDPAPVLRALAQGFLAGAPSWEVSSSPFGPGRAFAEAMEGDQRFCVLSVGDGDSLHEAGQRFREVLAEGKVPVLEGGHLQATDGGMSFLEGISGAKRQANESLEAWFARAIEHAQNAVSGREFYAAYSTSRPLFGPSSTLALEPDLSLRDSGDTAFNRRWAELLHKTMRPQLAVSGQSASVVEPGRLPGSGASGGAAAIVGLLGGRLVSDGDFLLHHTDCESFIEASDLVIICEPELHSPALAESSLNLLTEIASRSAIPVLAIGTHSTLSAHERAQWGIHGILVDETGNLDALGYRAARTWARQ